MHRCDVDAEVSDDVYIEDIVGDLNDLIGTPMLMAEMSTNSDPPAEDYDSSYTWTYYRFESAKGHVDVRWYGTSNGYYSEEVSLGLLAPDTEDAMRKPPSLPEYLNKLRAAARG